jgi:hypothetical protein
MNAILAGRNKSFYFPSTRPQYKLFYWVIPTIAGMYFLRGKKRMPKQPTQEKNTI